MWLLRAAALSCVRSAGVAVAVALLLLRLLREVAVGWGGRQGGGRTHDPELKALFRSRALHHQCDMMLFIVWLQMHVRVTLTAAVLHARVCAAVLQLLQRCLQAVAECVGGSRG
jgi:hypothetical protein